MEGPAIGWAQAGRSTRCSLREVTSATLLKGYSSGVTVNYHLGAAAVRATDRTAAGRSAPGAGRAPTRTLTEHHGIGWVDDRRRRGRERDQFSMRFAPVIYLAPVMLGGAGAPLGLGVVGSVTAIAPGNLLGSLAVDHFPFGVPALRRCRRGRRGPGRNFRMHRSRRRPSARRHDGLRTSDRWLDPLRGQRRRQQAGDGRLMDRFSCRRLGSLRERPAAAASRTTATNPQSPPPWRSSKPRHARTSDATAPPTTSKRSRCREARAHPSPPQDTRSRSTAEVIGRLVQQPTPPHDDRWHTVHSGGFFLISLDATDDIPGEPLRNRLGPDGSETREQPLAAW